VWEWDQTDMQVYHEAETAMRYYRQGQDAGRAADVARKRVQAG
jgi:hypothetical protein